MSLLLTGAGNSGAAGGGAFSPTSTQSTNFLTRVAAVTGTGAPTYGLSTNERNAVDALITGLVTDLGGNTSLSTWPIIDALYVFATTGANTRGVALLNLVSSSYTCVENVVAAGQFTADQGYTGVSLGYLNTQFNPTTVGGQNWSQNSATFAAYSFATISTDVKAMGGSGAGSNEVRIYPNFSAQAYMAANQAAFDPFTGSGKFYGVSRTGAGAVAYYIDATNATSTRASVAPVGPTLVLLADKNDGTNSFTGTLSAALIGGGMTTVQMGNVNTRLSTYMASIP